MVDAMALRNLSPFLRDGPLGEGNTYGIAQMLRLNVGDGRNTGVIVPRLLLSCPAVRLTRIHRRLQGSPVTRLTRSSAGRAVRRSVGQPCLTDPSARPDFCPQRIGHAG